jgi:hypothetical protein
MSPDGMGGSDCAEALAKASAHSKSVRTLNPALHRKRRVPIRKFMGALQSSLLLSFCPGAVVRRSPGVAHSSACDPTSTEPPVSRRSLSHSHWPRDRPCHRAPHRRPSCSHGASNIAPTDFLDMAIYNLFAIGRHSSPKRAALYQERSSFVVAF